METHLLPLADASGYQTGFEFWCQSLVSELREAGWIHAMRVETPLTVSVVRPIWLAHVQSQHIHVLASLVIVASACLSLAYIWFLCPLDLASDEAHYWDWSLRLDWSYYSKGPLAAWLIRASCELFGSLSVAVRGDLAAAVRLPAVVCHTALLAGSYLLATGVFRSPRLGLAVVLAEASIPLVRVGAVLMTIDPPFLACWCWALVSVWKATGRVAVSAGRSVTWWTAAAAFIFLGTLAKYTMALFPIAVAVFLLVHRRSEFRRLGFWVFLAGGLLAWVPIVEWNARHDWASFRHVLGQVGSDRLIGIRFNGLGPLSFAGAQAGMLFGGWLLAFLAAGWRYRPSRESDPGVALPWWCSAPVWTLFAIASFVKNGQPNWPAPAYVGGMILAVAWVREVLIVGSSPPATTDATCDRRDRRRQPGGDGARTLPRPGTTRAALVAGQSTAEKPLPVRSLDISARLTGWKTLAAEVDRIRTEVATATGEKPVLAGTNWTIPGHLRFYCRDRPERLRRRRGERFRPAQSIRLLAAESERRRSMCSAAALS